MARHGLWRRWLLLVTTAELAGFVAPAAVGVWASGLGPLAQLLLLPAAGVVEGAALGAGQAWVLRDALPGFRSRRWVVATALAAGLAWLLGMLPYTTYAVWSAWPRGWALALGGVVGALLLASIGTAQALVLPGTAGPTRTWVGWTALGWCVGLAAFAALATPLWHAGQPTWWVLLVGVGAGLAMAATMAAVTGVGVVRLVARADRSRRRLHAHERAHGPLSGLLGAPVHDAAGRRVGEVRDLVVDLAGDLDHPPVTHLVVGGWRARAVVPWSSVAAVPVDDVVLLLEDPAPWDGALPSRTQLLLRRDVLDSPVVTADPPARRRVGDVVLDVGPGVASVSGLDLSHRAALRRLVVTPERSWQPSPLVPLDRVHLGSRRGHAAQQSLRLPAARDLTPTGVAEVVTRLPVAHARDLLDSVDARARSDVVDRLHPEVRARVTVPTAPVRRTRRLAGWRLRRPRAGGRR